MKSMQRVLAASAACALGAFAAAAVTADPAPSRSMTIAMVALNGSGQTGTAVLTDAGGKVRLSVQLSGEPATASEPAHVHFGRCPVIKAVPAYNVGPIVDGKATNVVDLTWEEITTGKYALNVHQSTANLDRYVSCGNIGNSVTPIALPSDDSGY